MQSADTLSTFEAQLPAELESVVAARHLVESAATAWEMPRSVTADAALAASELVTNAVLHAGTAIRLVAKRLGRGMRIEVGDGSTRLPVVGAERPEDLLATRSMTGRGLKVVAATVDRWGADPRPGGKTMWAEVGTDRRHLTPVPAPAFPPQAKPEELSAASAAAGVSAVTAVAAQGRRVHLVGVPVNLLVESVRQLADLQREMQVIGLDNGGPSELVALAHTSRELDLRIGDLRESGLQQAEAAMARGDSIVDFDMEVPADAAALLDRLASLLRRVRGGLVRRHLLTLPASDEVIEYRTWYRNEIVAQLSGRSPQPCPLGLAQQS